MQKNRDSSKHPREGLFTVPATIALSMLLFFPVVLTFSACRSCESKARATDKTTDEFDALYGLKEFRRMTGTPSGESIDFDNWYHAIWSNSLWTKIPAWQETGEEIIWYNVTSLKTGESRTERFRLTVSIGLDGPDPGAGFGYGREVYADILHYERLGSVERPKAPDGVYPLLPGECVIRPIPINEGSQNTILNEYAIEIPAGVAFQPFLTVSPDYEMLEIAVEKAKQQIFRERVDINSELFVAKEAGMYTIKVLRTPAHSEKTGWYGIDVSWGSGRSSRCEKKSSTNEKVAERLKPTKKDARTNVQKNICRQANHDRKE